MGRPLSQQPVLDLTNLLHGMASYTTDGESSRPVPAHGDTDRGLPHWESAWIDLGGEG